MARIDKRTVAAASPRVKTFIIYDDTVPGLGLRVTPTGAKSFTLDYRAAPGGRGAAKHRMTLGKTTVMSPSQARQAALDALAAVRRGHDPQAIKAADQAAITVAGLIDMYAESPYREMRRERFLGDEELRRLGASLRDAEAGGKIDLFAIAAIRLLLFTGCRMREILDARWDWVDWQRGMLVLPDTKTGRRSVWLNEPALAVLKRLPRIEGNPFVIPGRGDGHRVNLHRPWRAITRAAGLEGVRVHDLRHSHASAGAAAGLSLPLIGKLLGHSQPSTTSRYAHLGNHPVVRAASENEKVGGGPGTRAGGLCSEGRATETGATALSRGVFFGDLRTRHACQRAPYARQTASPSCGAVCQLDIEKETDGDVTLFS